MSDQGFRKTGQAPIIGVVQPKDPHDSDDDGRVSEQDRRAAEQPPVSSPPPKQ